MMKRIMKQTLPFVVALLFAMTACKEETTIDDLVELAPSACKEYCNAYYACEYPDDYFSGDYGDDHLENLVDECKIDCGWYLSEGSYVIQYDWDSEPTVYNYLEFIDGKKIRDYFKCMMNTGYYECYEDDYWGDYEMLINSEERCLAYSECWQLLDSEYLGNVTWEPWEDSSEGHCSMEEPEDDNIEIYFDFPYVDTEFYDY